MATGNETIVFYVNDQVTPKTVSGVRVNSENLVLLADARPVIQIRERRPDGSGGWFEDVYDGWEFYDCGRFKGKGSAADGSLIVRGKSKDGGTPAQAKCVEYSDDESPGVSRDFPAGVYQAAGGGTSAGFAGYDLDADDYDDLLDDANAITSSSISLTT